MKTLKVSTQNPQSLITEIQSKINDREITSWNYEESNNSFSHKGEQYKDHFYIEAKIDNERGLIIFHLHSDGDAFAESRAFQLLERMLLPHFEGKVEIIK